MQCPQCHPPRLFHRRIPPPASAHTPNVQSARSHPVAQSEPHHPRSSHPSRIQSHPAPAQSPRSSAAPLQAAQTRAHVAAVAEHHPPPPSPSHRSAAKSRGHASGTHPQSRPVVPAPRRHPFYLNRHPVRVIADEPRQTLSCASRYTNGRYPTPCTTPRTAQSPHRHQVFPLASLRHRHHAWRNPSTPAAQPVNRIPKTTPGSLD